jgi:hypothetical protein
MSVHKSLISKDDFANDEYLEGEAAFGLDLAVSGE